MKKVTVLVGSARKGNSLFLARKVAEKCSAEVVQIASKEIAMCTGCLDCDETKRCVFDDDMTELIQTVVDSDIIVIVTPVRWGLLSGDVKLFIDRLNPIATTEELVGKKLIAVAIGQSESDDSSIPHALETLSFFAESAGMEMLGAFPVFECLTETDLAEKVDVVDTTVTSVINLLG